jgi:tRNA (Thr-GGU) A37 N-methylase
MKRETLTTMSLTPIGVIRANVIEQQVGGFVDGESLIELRPEYAEFLGGIEDYSHIHVMYWLSEMTESMPKTQPQGNPEVPVVGMFACR